MLSEAPFPALKYGQSSRAAVTSTTTSKADAPSLSRSVESAASSRRNWHMFSVESESPLYDSPAPACRTIEKGAIVGVVVLLQVVSWQCLSIFNNKQINLEHVSEVHCQRLLAYGRPHQRSGGCIPLGTASHRAPTVVPPTSRDSIALEAKAAVRVQGPQTSQDGLLHIWLAQVLSILFAQEANERKQSPELEPTNDRPSMMRKPFAGMIRPNKPSRFNQPHDLSK